MEHLVTAPRTEHPWMEGVPAHQEIIEQMTQMTSGGWGSWVLSVNRISSKYCLYLLRIIQNFPKRVSSFWHISRSILGPH